MDIHALGELMERANQVQVWGDGEVGALFVDLIGAIATLSDRIAALENAVVLQGAEVAS